MKRVVAASLSFVFVLSLVGCAEGIDNASDAIVEYSKEAAPDEWPVVEAVEIVEEEVEAVIVVEVPGGSLSFEVKESWRSGYDDGGLLAYRPLADSDGIKIFYEVTENYGVVLADGSMTEEFLKNAFTEAYYIESMEGGFEEFALPALDGYLSFTYVKDFYQADFGNCKIYVVMTGDSEGNITSLAVRIPYDLLGEWEEELSEFLDSLKPLPNAFRRQV